VTAKKSPHFERRSGADRRNKEVLPLDKRERRRSIEPRKPEVAEIELSAEEWAALQGAVHGQGPHK
jgi:hypothetical protein